MDTDSESVSEAVTLTGCSQYLAVASFIFKHKSTTVSLLTRDGKFMSKATDSGNPKFEGGHNTTHRMEFSLYGRRLYLIAQSLFTYVNLYVVNDKRQAEIVYIRSVIIEENSIHWTLITLSCNAGNLITVNMPGQHRMIKIRINDDDQVKLQEN